MSGHAEAHGALLDFYAEEWTPLFRLNQVLQGTDIDQEFPRFDPAMACGRILHSTVRPPRYYFVDMPKASDQSPKLFVATVFSEEDHATLIARDGMALDNFDPESAENFSVLQEELGLTLPNGHDLERFAGVLLDTEAFFRA